MSEHLRVADTVRSETETKRIEVDVDRYEERRALVATQIPEGWKLLSWRVDRTAAQGTGE
jgi:hypothetical protein